MSIFGLSRINQKGFAPIFILVIAGFAVLGFLVFKNQSVPGQNNITQEKIAPQTISQPSSAKIPVLPNDNFLLSKPTTQPLSKSNPILVPSSTPTPTPTNNLNPTPTNTPIPTRTVFIKNIHLYPYYGADEKASINKTNIIGIVFVPKNINTQIKSEWLTNMDKVFARIKSFYQTQFENNIEITYQVNASPIKGEKNIEDYYPWDLAKEIEDKNQSLLKSGSHNIWMIYLVRDAEMKLNLKGGSLGGLANLNAATQYEYWLNNEAVDQGTYGIVGAAHEFGHALGIPHPWDLSANINHDPNFGNVSGDIMGYSTEKDLDQNYIRNDVKQTMGL